MLMHVNGNDVLNNPSNAGNWYGVSITQQHFGDNVRWLDRSGVALYDA